MSIHELQSKFHRFIQNIELTENQRNKVIHSHKHLRENILQNLDYVNGIFLTGSYKKNTMIRPLNDVDIAVIIKHDRSEIRPYSILGQLKSDLKSAYPNCFIGRDKPCIILKFKRWRFELIPAIENSRGYYIPHSDLNEWQLTEDPRKIEKKLSKANYRLNGLLTPLIKMMKKCKKHHKIKSPKSFEMEEIAINKLWQVSSYRDGVQKLLRAYNWRDKTISYDRIERMTDDEFAGYAKNTLFGPDFPK